MPTQRKDDRLVHLNSAPQMAEYLAAADRIAAAGHGAVLDWGCGFGQMSDLLRRRGVDTTSCDYDPSAAGDGELRDLDLFPGVQATFTSHPVRLPYADDQFDAVLSMGVLEHVADPEGSLDELGRILKPGGLLYVYKLPNRFSYLEAIARRTGQHYHGERPEDTLYTVPSARELHERHGYDVLKVRYANMLPLTVPGRLTTTLAPLIWAVNRILARVPGLNRLSTNVELVARRR